MHKTQSGKYALFCVRFVTFVLVFALISFCFTAIFYSCAEKINSAASGEIGRIYIIDAGHGGVDGGALGYDGTRESDLNLKTAVIVRDIMTVLGHNTVLTRDSDTMLSDGGEGTNKMRDLRCRLKICNDNPEGVFVSIHMNKFPDTKYSGLQVWYSPNDKSSGELASSIQSCARKILEPTNDRETKTATSAIYLLYHSKIPSVLVECGFLSNKDELAKLKTHEYRQKLGAAIAIGVLATDTSQ
jgi:N-acetylmuramoyl-L-alanine amidase